MDIADSIWNADDSKRGYELGYTDGKSGKPRHNFKAALKAVQSLKVALHGSEALDTFYEGYDAGYKKGIEDRHTKEQPQKVQLVSPTPAPQTTYQLSNNQYSTQKNVNVMPSLQDYYVQLEQLNELVQFLNQFNEDMSNKLNEYIQRVETLKENGLPVQTANKFNVEHIAETANFIHQIKQLIEDRSLPFTHTNIQITEDLIKLNQ